MSEMMIYLTIAAISGAAAGGVAWGLMVARVLDHGHAIKAVHARLDGLILALANHGLIDAGAVAHLARKEGRDDEHFR
jgi:hypothetical protein